MTKPIGSGKQTKKDAILDAARALDRARFTSTELEQIRRQVIALHGAAGNVSVDYVASVLADAGWPVVRSARADTGGRYEDEFRELLRFSSLDEAEMCLIRLDELLRKFVTEGERAAVERVREVGRRGRRRAEMIARNRKVDGLRRAEKEEIARWFAIWLEGPDMFFDWLEVRKHTEDFGLRFGERKEQDD